MKKKEPFTIFGSKRTGDEESLMDGKEYSDRDSSNPLFDFHSIFSDKEITPSDKYNEVIGAKRRVYVACYLVLLLVSPLIFRYAMGSFSPDKTETIRFLLPDNATMTTTVDFEKCLECIDYDGVTVAEIGVAVANVTNPDKSGNIPSIAVFASQDFENWSDNSKF